jgi:hypothetical protein
MKWMKANPQIGEIWFIEFSYDQKPRYALVVGSDSDARLAVSSVLQITTQHGGTDYEVTLPRVPWLREQSYVNAQTVQPVKWTEFIRKAPGGSIRLCWLKSSRPCPAGWHFKACNSARAFSQSSGVRLAVTAGKN